MWLSELMSYIIEGVMYALISQINKAQVIIKIYHTRKIIKGYNIYQRKARSNMSRLRKSMCRNVTNDAIP